MLFHRTTLPSCMILTVLLASSAFGDEALPIPPVVQETPSWCWAAVGEMVFRYHDIPSVNPVGDYQCGIVALMHPVCDSNCLNCPFPAGSLSYMDEMLRRYPEVARLRTHESSERLATRAVHRALSKSELQEEIDNDRPVVTGISPSGFSSSGASQHVALIVGYEEDDKVLLLIVNDPFPYDLQAFRGMRNPYLVAGGTELEPGQYRIKFESYRLRLRWAETIYKIRCRGTDCPN